MLAAGVKFDDEQEDQDGSQGVARAGPGWGHAEAPLAGLPPQRAAIAAQSAAEARPQAQLLLESAAAHAYSFQDGTLSGASGRSPSQSLSFQNKESAINP
jgi:hypothetical protein